MKNRPRVDEIIFNDITFRRYPDARQSNHRRYYSPGGGHIKKGIKALHVEIWKSVHGAVPPGCHIHHKDGDPLNNEIENLECLGSKEHFEHHAPAIRMRQSLLWRDKERHARIQAAATKWHRSDEGREWHRKHAQRVLGQRTPEARTCKQCGGVYKTKQRGDGTRFCAGACKSKWRRLAGLDNIDKPCERCETPFTSNKYAKNRFCSRVCSGKAVGHFGKG